MAGAGGHVGLALVEEMGRRFTAGDRDGAFTLLHDDFRIEQPGSLPHGGGHAGRDGMVAMGTQFAEHWDRTISAPTVHAWGDGVVQVTTQTWTSRATGRSATVDIVEVFRVTDGRVAEIRVFPQDTALLLATLD